MSPRRMQESCDEDGTWMASSEGKCRKLNRKQKEEEATASTTRIKIPEMDTYTKKSCQCDSKYEQTHSQKETPQALGEDKGINEALHDGRKMARCLWSRS